MLVGGIRPKNLAPIGAWLHVASGIGPMHNSRPRLTPYWILG